MFEWATHHYTALPHLIKLKGIVRSHKSKTMCCSNIIRRSLSSFTYAAVVILPGNAAHVSGLLASGCNFLVKEYMAVDHTLQCGRAVFSSRKNAMHIRTDELFREY